MPDRRLSECCWDQPLDRQNRFHSASRPMEDFVGGCGLVLYRDKTGNPRQTEPCKRSVGCWGQDVLTRQYTGNSPIFFSYLNPHGYVL